MKKIIETDVKSLTANELKRLATGGVMAIRIADFVSKNVISEASSGLFNHAEKGSLGHAKEFTRLGIAYAEIKNDKVRNAYHREALKNIQRVRDLFSSGFSPIDRFRLLLDDVWSEGASLLAIDGKKCFVGVCRYLTPGIDLKPHIDRLEWVIPPKNRCVHK